MFLPLVMTLLHCACSNIINIYNGDDSTTHSFAEYPVWTDTVQGQATLEFKFKTNSKSCVLLFVNDGITRNGGKSLEIYIERKFFEGCFFCHI